MTTQKLRVRRNGRIWVVEQDGVMVDWSRSFRKACLIAQEWFENGWYVAKGWTRR